MPEEKLEVVEVGAWEAGHHEATGKIVMIFRWTDQEPIALGFDPTIAEEVGKGLIALAAQARRRKH